VLDASKRSDGFLDFPLSDDGRMSVVEAQQFLKKIPLTKIITADLKRTKETAEIIASGTMSNPEVVAAPEGRTWNLGTIAGMKKRYGRPEVQALIDDPDKWPEGGESYNFFQNRFLPWFKEQTAGRGPILYVGSGSNLRLLGFAFTGDMDALDLDEGGLACLHIPAAQAYCEVILGADDQQEEVS
jgi:broad specificity phosphatase PhoE